MIDARMKLVADPVPIVEGLTRTLQKRAIARAIKKALPPVQAAVKSGAEQTARYGFLAQSIGVRVKQYRTAVVGVVGPLSKFRRRKGVRTRGKNKGEPIWHRPAYYAHLVEGGSKRSRAHPFLTPALDRTKQQYLDTVTDLIGQEIKVELDKRRAK